MTSHTIHPDSHENGLADGCPRCDEHAQAPLVSLDAANVRMLVERIDGGLEPRSANEAAAMMKIDVAVRQARRLQELGVLP